MRDLLQRRNYVLRYLGACLEQPPAWGSGSSTRSSNNAHAHAVTSHSICAADRLVEEQGYQATVMNG